MIRKILTTAAVLAVVAAAPAMAQLDRHQNPSLNSYVGFATDSQYQQPTALGSATNSAQRIEPVGSGNPSLESFNPNAVNDQPTRFETAPSVAENPDFGWIDQADIGA